MRDTQDTLLWGMCGRDLERVEAKTVFDCADAGDKIAMELLDQYITYLAEGIANLINIFQPAVLCIGGGVSRAGEQLLLPLREKITDFVYSKNSSHNTSITLARLDNDAGIVGAALLGLNDKENSHETL